jgi:hypothetical protein
VAHRERYVLDYVENRDGLTAVTAAVRKMESWMHRRVAARQQAGEIVLELGAGTLNHASFETSAARYDFIEPFEALWQGREARRQLNASYNDVDRVPGANQYDRVFSIAVLEHLTDLPAVLGRCGLLMKEGALFQAGIPSEGALLWGMAWRYVTGVAYRIRTGLDYATLMRHEHVNDADEIVELSRYLFSDVRVSRFPTPWHHLSVYSYIEARGPLLERCREMVARKADTAR